LADAPHSKCGIERCVGSSPTSGTVFPQVRVLFPLWVLTKPPKVLTAAYRLLCGQHSQTQRLTAHPGAVNLMIGGPMDGPRALALNEHLMETLRDSGLEAGEAARASYLLIVYVFGSIALETAGLSDGLSGFSEAERIASRLEGFSAIPAAGYPLSAGAAAIMATYVSTQQYRWGLHKVLDGLTRT
jgi:hypothetical protein